MGGASFAVYEKNSTGKIYKSIEGFYKKNFVRHDTTMNLVIYGGKGYIEEKAYFYIPTKDGTWNYYQDNGKILKSETY